MDVRYLTDLREPFFEVAKEYISASSVILDMGCGDALFAKYLKRNDIFLLDGNAETVQTLKSQFINVEQGSSTDLPYQDNFFDLIHTSHMVEHLSPEQLYSTLKEIDRCLKHDGYVIISAPMLWEQFYDDLSHLKPYYPKLFYKYLCYGQNMCCTRPVISSCYQQVKEVYRYSSVSQIYYINKYSNFVTSLLQIIRRVINKLGFVKVEKSGYTIVLRKTKCKNV